MEVTVANALVIFEYESFHFSGISLVKRRSNLNVSEAMIPGGKHSRLRCFWQRVAVYSIAFTGGVYVVNEFQRNPAFRFSLNGTGETSYNEPRRSRLNPATLI